jgi:hypothetical protein
MKVPERQILCLICSRLFSIQESCKQWKVSKFLQSEKKRYRLIDLNSFEMWAFHGRNKIITFIFIIKNYKKIITEEETVYIISRLKLNMGI